MDFVISGSPGERLDQIMNFWWTITSRWRPPSRHVTKPVAVMRLHDIRDMERNAKLSLSRIFPKGLDFCVVESTRSKKKVFYTVKCTFPIGGHTLGRGITAEKAEYQAARSALESVLGDDFYSYETVLSARNYNGISGHQFRTAWTRAYSWWDFRTQPDPPPLRFPRDRDIRRVEVSSNRRNPNVSHVGVVSRIQSSSTSSSRGSSESGNSQQEMRAVGSNSDTNEPPNDQSYSGAGTSNSQTASASKEQSKSAKMPTINKSVQAKDPQTSKSPEGKTEQNSNLQSTMNPVPAKSVVVGKNTSNVGVHHVAQLDSSILNWDPVKWKPLLKKEREDVLFRFWSKTSITEFPRTFSLLGQRNVTTTNCLRAFNSLFSYPKCQINWTIKGESPARILCNWTDSNNRWSEPIEGEGKLMDDAKRDAAHKALLAILGQANLKLLEHICRPFFVEGPENQKVNLNSLKKRILDVRNKMPTPLNSPTNGMDKRAQLELAVTRRISAGCDGESRLSPEKTASNHSDPVPMTSTTALSSQTSIPRRLQLPTATSTVVVPSIPETPPTTPTDRVQMVNIEQPAPASISLQTASSPVPPTTSHSHPAMSTVVEADTVAESSVVPASCSSSSSLVIQIDNSSDIHTSSTPPIRETEQALVNQSGPQTTLPVVEVEPSTEEPQLKHVPPPQSQQSSASHMSSSPSGYLNGTPRISAASAGVNSQNPPTRIRVASGTSQHPSTSKKRKKGKQFDDHPFAEYFSTNDEGTVNVSPWLKKYLKDSLLVDVEEEDRKREESQRDLLKLLNERKEKDTPFLPFDKILGYEFPQEAEIALELLFEGRKEPKPIYDTTKYVFAEVTVGSKVFQGLGMTEEEAKENASVQAVKFLCTTNDESSDQSV